MSEQIQSQENPQSAEIKAEAPPKVADDKFAESFQRITKQEAHLAAERKKIQESRALYEADLERAKKYDSLKGKDPFEILEHFGITYDKLLEADKQRRNPVDPNTKKALEAVENLKREIELQKEEALKEKRSKTEVQVKAAIDKVIREHEFDVLEKLNASDTVYEYMNEIYDQTGEIPEYKDACQAVMDNILEQYKKIADSKHLKRNDVVNEVKEAPIVAKSEAISNKMTQSTPTSDKPMTDAERLKAAAAVFRSFSK